LPGFSQVQFILNNSVIDQVSVAVFFRVLCAAGDTIAGNLLNCGMWVCCSIGFILDACVISYAMSTYSIQFLDNIDDFYSYNDVSKMWIKLGRAPVKA